MSFVQCNEFYAALKSLGIHLPDHCLSATIHMPSGVDLVSVGSTNYLPKCDGNDVPKGAYVLGGKGSGGPWAQDKRFVLVEDEPDAIVRCLLQVLRARRDEVDDAELRHAFNEACDRLDVLESKLVERGTAKGPA